MIFVKDLIADLVEKRLWPIAVGLLALLVAVPVVLIAPSRPARVSAATQAQLADAQREAAAAQPVVSIATTTGIRDYKRRLKADRARNPFIQQFAPKALAATAGVPVLPTASAGTSGSSAGGTTAGGSAGGSTGGSTKPSSTPKTPSKSSATYDLYSADLRFGEAGATKQLKKVVRLTALPSTTAPVVVYLGVMEDKKTAAFLISSDAAATGEGKCVPDEKTCTIVHLKAGETEFLDVSGGTAGLVQYELRLVKINRTTTRDKQAAVDSYARESKAGRRILSEISSPARALRALRLSPRSGTLFYAAAPRSR